jgi:hypothetical protein
MDNERRAKRKTIMKREDVKTVAEKALRLGGGFPLADFPSRSSTEKSIHQRIGGEEAFSSTELAAPSPFG